MRPTYSKGIKDSTFIRTESNARPDDPNPGKCSRYGQTLIILHSFSDKGHLAVCGNRICPDYAQPQRYLKYPRFAQNEIAPKLQGVCNWRIRH
jgi:hypothetical protein